MKFSRSELKISRDYDSAEYSSARRREELIECSSTIVSENTYYLSELRNQLESVLFACSKPLETYITRTIIIHKGGFVLYGYWLSRCLKSVFDIATRASGIPPLTHNNTDTCNTKREFP